MSFTSSWRKFKRRTGKPSPLTRRRRVCWIFFLTDIALSGQRCVAARGPLYVCASITDVFYCISCSVAYYVAFGPHGPRKPVTPPGGNLKAAIATVGLIAAAGGIFALIRSRGKCL